MRKIKLQTQVSIDGYIAGENGEMDFLVRDWDPELIKFIQEITDPVDCIVLGRDLAEGFIPHWASVANNPEDPEYLAGRKFTETHKVVFTKSLEQSPWENTVLAKGDLVKEITDLKNMAGKDIIAYGGATFVSNLIKNNLIDELNLLINPTAIGKGMPIFNQIENPRHYQLIRSQSFDCGIVALTYAPIAD